MFARDLSRRFQTLRRFLYRPLRVYQRTLGLTALKACQNPGAAHIVKAIENSLRQDWAPEERRWIKHIEQRRAVLRRSSRAIVRRDFGAGRPGAILTQAEMTEGVDVPDTVGHVCQLVSKSPFWCSVLFSLVRAVRPLSAVEMGTALGISAGYQAAALKLNGRGYLVSIEGDRGLAEIAASNLRELCLVNTEIVVGRFQDALPRVLDAQRPIDYVFIDGHHDEQATLGYFELIQSSLAPNAMVVFDDIGWSEGMVRAWKRLSTDSRFLLSVDLGAMGICILGRSDAPPRSFYVPLS